MMHPDLEVVEVRRDESFKVWSHGYPYRTIRWHFHPEFELHLIVATHGKYFVGDHIGSFGPGHLVLLGPNLPHNWVSDMAEGETVERRNLVIQFDPSFVRRCMDAFPECRDAQTLLDDARRGVGFDGATSAAIAPLFDELLTARGMRRIALFMTILERLLGHDAWTTRQLVLRSQELSTSSSIASLKSATGACAPRSTTSSAAWSSTPT